MSIQQTVPSMYCKSVPTLQKAWDNTSIKALKACNYLYHKTIGTGFRPKRVHPRLDYGTYFHWGMEQYEKLRVKKISQEEALHKIIPLVLARMKNFPEDDTTYTKQNLIRAIIWYVDQYYKDVAETYIMSDGRPAVELSFRVPLPINSPDGDPYIYCGHIDRMVTYAGLIYNTDYKTTKYALDNKYFKQFSPDSQMSGYIYGTKIGFNEPIAGAMIDGIQLGVTYNRFARRFVLRTEEQTEEWLENTCHWIKVAEAAAISGKWYMNEEFCSMYGGCAMREVCSKSLSTRELWYRNKFHHAPWNPLENR